MYTPKIDSFTQFLYDEQVLILLLIFSYETYLTGLLFIKEHDHLKLFKTLGWVYIYYRNEPRL